MDLLECYFATCQVALASKSTDPSTWQELHTLLPELHRHLSCQLCHKLVDHPNSNGDGFACSVCVNVNPTTTEDSVESITLTCYKKLCKFIQASPQYNVMCSRDEDSNLIKILDEVNGVISHPVDNNTLVNGAVNTIQETVEINSNNNIESNSMESNIQLPINNEASNNFVNLRSRSYCQDSSRIPIKKKRLYCGCGKPPSKITCFGTRCVCYSAKRPCDGCRCRGCQNPIPKSSSDNENSNINQKRPKPVNLELVSSLKPVNITSSSFTTNDNMLLLPSPSQDGTEVTLGYGKDTSHCS